MNTRCLGALAVATLLSIVAPTWLAAKPEQDVVAPRPVSVVGDIPPNTVSRPVTIDRGIPLNVVSRPVTIDRGIPLNVVSRPVTIDRGIPLNIVSRPVTIDRGIPLNVVSRPVTIDRGIPLNVVSRPFTLAVCPAGQKVVGEPDCNNNGTLDICEIANCTGDPACADCNGNDVLDECETLEEVTGPACADGVDNDCDGLVDCADPDCDTVVACLGACCLQDGSCEEILAADCTLQGGTPRSLGSVCAGDNDGNGVDDACQPNELCDTCGLVSHWVDTCPAGEEFILSQALVGIDTTLDCVQDTSVVLSGPVVIAHGSGAPSTHSIDAEILAMNLVGGGVTLRAGAILDLQPSTGQIVEQPGDDTLADSHFDLFFVVTGDGLLGPVYNQDAFRVGSVIDCLPPKTTYVHDQQCIPLYDSPIPGQGTVVANLVSANHTTLPGCGNGTCDTDNGENVCSCPIDCGAAPPSELPGSTCSDGVDNDCDGLVDCDDPDCAAAVACLGACCLPDLSCEEILAEDCTLLGGTPRSLGSVCDNDGNGIPDECVATGDCNGNGIPDVDERLKKRAFCIPPCRSPCSNGAEWSLRVDWDGAGPNFTELNCQAVPISGSTREDMAQGLADCINGAVCPSITAVHIAPPCLIVSAPAAPVKICVGLAGLTPDCCVSAGLACSFNPDLVELVLSEADCNRNGADDAIDIFLETSKDDNENGIPDECENPVPTVSEWGMMVMALLLLAGIKLKFGRRRLDGTPA